MAYTFEEFKKEARECYPNITCRTLRELWYLEQQNTVADTPPPQPTCCVEVNNQEVDQTMFDECTAPRKVRINAPMANAQVISAVPVEATQRDYTIERVKALGEKFAQGLRKQFHMDSDRPTTAVELITAIENKTYTLDTNLLRVQAEEIKKGYFNNEYGINWGLPADVAGYGAAKEVLKAATQKALDGATLKPIDALEGVITDFEAWVYTPAA